MKRILLLFVVGVLSAPSLYAQGKLVRGAAKGVSSKQVARQVEKVTYRTSVPRIPATVTTTPNYMLPTGMVPIAVPPVPAAAVKPAVSAVSEQGYFARLPQRMAPAFRSLSNDEAIAFLKDIDADDLYYSSTKNEFGEVQTDTVRAVFNKVFSTDFSAVPELQERWFMEEVPFIVLEREIPLSIPQRRILTAYYDNIIREGNIATDKDWKRTLRAMNFYGLFMPVESDTRALLEVAQNAPAHYRHFTDRVAVNAFFELGGYEDLQTLAQLRSTQELAPHELVFWDIAQRKAPASVQMPHFNAPEEGAWEFPDKPSVEPKYYQFQDARGVEENNLFSLIPSGLRNHIHTLR